MGYDCYVRNPRISRPPLNFSEGGLADYWEWQDKSGAYFRRNIFAAARLGEALVEMGMGFDAYQWVQPQPFPRADLYGVTFDEWKDDAGEWHDRWIGDRAEEYQKAVEAHLRWHGPEIPGIPIHKVCTSNDGWIVTREECDAALSLYEFAIRDGRPHPEAFDDDFIPFLRMARDCDGFEVH